jgi:hypothetical protein
MDGLYLVVLAVDGGINPAIGRAVDSNVVDVESTYSRRRWSSLLLGFLGVRVGA